MNRRIRPAVTPDGSIFLEGRHCGFDTGRSRRYISAGHGDPVVSARREQMIRECLRWLVNDGLALKVDCAAERDGKSRIDYQVTVTWPDGSTAPVKDVWNVL
jgi:hypothetical protein